MLENKKYRQRQEEFKSSSLPGVRTHTSSSYYLETRFPSTSTSAAPHCSHLSESRDCSINSCFSWKVQKKEECFLPSKEQKCGKGTRKLLYTCVDHNGVSFTFLYNIPQVELLKNIKNLTPFSFDSMVMLEDVDAHIDHKKGNV